jgi:hypothetical protein
MLYRKGFVKPDHYNTAEFLIKTVAVFPSNKEKCLENIQVNNLKL